MTDSASVAKAVIELFAQHLCGLCGFVANRREFKLNKAVRSTRSLFQIAQLAARIALLPLNRQNAKVHQNCHQQ